MRIKSSLLLVTFLALGQIVAAQSKEGLNDIQEIKTHCQTIVDQIGNDKIATAFENLREIWYLPDDEMDYIEQQTIEQINLVEPRFGKFIGSQKVKEDLIDGVLYRVFYVIKYEMHGLRVQFIFYNGKGGKWYLNNFKWDDSLSKLFDD